jgi:hypothetical protein
MPEGDSMEYAAAVKLKINELIIIATLLWGWKRL